MSMFPSHDMGDKPIARAYDGDLVSLQVGSKGCHCAKVESCECHDRFCGADGGEEEVRVAKMVEG
jgi:hypothetical protein